MYKLS